MVYVIVALLGLALGSFVNALVWRTYLVEQNAKSKTQKGKKQPTTNNQQLTISIWRGRSMCPECQHELAVIDLVPVFSWLALKGKCRYCKKPISPQYPMVELLTAGLFVLTYIFWPFPLASIANYFLLSTFYFLLTQGIALAVYDLKWMILPNKLVYTFTGFSGIFLIVLFLQERSLGVLVSGLMGAACYSGFFWLLYQFSQGKWIGGGDVRLAIGLGLMLGWQKSVLSLMVAAYMGTLVVLGLWIIGKYRPKLKLPFGPFLLAGSLVALLYGRQVIEWYLHLGGF